MSTNDCTKFLENIKQRFKRTISWNIYRYEATTQTKNNNLDYLVDPTFRNINLLFLLSFKNGNNDPTRNSFDNYCMPLVEIKYFNAFINIKPFLGKPVKTSKECMKNLLECQETIIQQEIY